jgi:hypothetical protein
MVPSCGNASNALAFVFMAKKKKAAIKNVILILFCLGLSSCAGFEKLTESIGGFFHGNTEVDKRDYDLEAKREYRKYNSLRLQKIKDNEEKILNSVESRRDVTSPPKSNQKPTTERRLILKYQKDKDTKPVLEKLLNP